MVDKAKVWPCYEVTMPKHVDATAAALQSWVAAGYTNSIVTVQCDPPGVELWRNVRALLPRTGVNVVGGIKPAWEDGAGNRLGPFGPSAHDSLLSATAWQEVGTIAAAMRQAGATMLFFDWEHALRKWCQDQEQADVADIAPLLTTMQSRISGVSKQFLYPLARSSSVEIRARMACWATIWRLACPKVSLISQAWREQNEHIELGLDWIADSEAVLNRVDNHSAKWGWVLAYPDENPKTWPLTRLKWAVENQQAMYGGNGRAILFPGQPWGKPDRVAAMVEALA
jgi:hypothetical protein